MKRAFLAVVLLLPLALGVSRGQPADPAPEQPAAQPSDLTQLVQDARVLYVARTLRLRTDQVAAIIPLLGQAHERIEQRDKLLDDLWARNEGAFVDFNQALLAGQAPAQNAVGAVERVTAAHDEVRDRARADLEQIADNIIGVLDKQQVTRVETLGDIRAHQQSQQRASGSPAVIADIARYATAMRGLTGEDYDALRVTMALQLADQLGTRNSREFNNAVSAVLRILDSVRRLTDAQFAQAEPELQASIARGLGLPQEAPAYPVSFDDMMAFVTYDRTVTLLGSYQADPAMEVIP
jgi:hypothetical protein